MQPDFGFLAEWPSVGPDNQSNDVSSVGLELKAISHECQHTKQTFRPGKYITSNLQVESNEQMDVGVDPNIDFEPVRLVPGGTPPKRFYRTFWRSAAQRILAKTDAQK